MKLKKALAITLAVILSLYAGLFVHNNYWNSDFSKSEIDIAYEKSVTWIYENREEISNKHNPMLWWMLIEALKIENDQKLRSVVDNYRQKNNQFYKQSPWRFLIYGTASEINALDILTSQLPDYNKHFIYGYSCNKELENSEIIRIQNDTDYCLKNKPISPACLTHQLMSFRFMERTGCEDKEITRKRIGEISDSIVTQLTFDVRLVDVYAQRVMMLVDSGHRAKLKDRWIARIIHAQLADGGWGDFQPLIPVGGGKHLGFSSKGIAIKSPHSTFHTTAQGVYLMSLLKKDLNANEHEE
jgi:hypothetical protein